MVNQDEGKNEDGGESERPGAIISNHVSYLDILYHMSASFPSFVAKVWSLFTSPNLLPLCRLLINNLIEMIYSVRFGVSADIFLPFFSPFYC